MASLALAATALWAVAMPAGNARRPSIKVLGTPGVREFYAELVRPIREGDRAQGRRRPGPARSTSPSGSAAARPVDLVIMARNSLEELIRLGKIVPGSRVDVAKSGIGLAVRAGAPRPDISVG